MPVETPRRERSAEEMRGLIRDRIVPSMTVLARCKSTRELHAHPEYQRLAGTIHHVLETPEIGHFSRGEAPARDRYRFLAWNLERGIQLDGQLEAFRSHPYLSACDVLLLSETDLGMARSGNRDVARTLAKELGFDYAFVPCYLNLAKGSGEEHATEGENELGLHGNALLSRYPIRNVRAIPLANGIDKMSGREKRIGRQAAVAAEVVFPNATVTAVSVHLDANSTQRHRREQLEAVIDAIGERGAAVVGGDWNTTTFNSSTARNAILGYWLRVLMGPSNVIRNHYLHPYRRFERELFDMLESRGFDYRESNRLGEHTMYYEFENERTYKGLSEWVPQWCFPFIRWALREHDGRCPLKLDWFATRGLKVADPAVIHDVREGRETPLSDHDAIGLDIRIR